MNISRKVVNPLRTNIISSSSSRLNNALSMNRLGLFNTCNIRSLSSYPTHELVGMPALSPTMEAGTIASWLIKEGEGFSTGDAICEIETDKATVTFDATDDGFLAKILAPSGEIAVGEPLMITVEEQDDVAAFASYVVTASAKPTSTPTPPATPTPAAATMAAPTPVTPATTPPVAVASGERVFASPLARKLARDSGLTINTINGSGPNGRIIAADVMTAIASGVVNTAQEISSTSSTTSMSNVPTGMTILPSNAVELAAHLTRTKQEVPHYYLTVEINLENLEIMRNKLNKMLSEDEQLGVLDCIIKACSGAMKAVPDVNGEWKDSFVRRYDQTDINLIMSAGSTLTTPVIRDVGSKGLKDISNEIRNFEDIIYGDDGEVIDSNQLAAGTFSVHNLGK